MNERLVEILREKKLTVNGIAKRIGMRQSTIQPYFAGVREPSVAFINALLAAFPDVDRGWLMGASDKPAPTMPDNLAFVPFYDTDRLSEIAAREITPNTQISLPQLVNMKLDAIVPAKGDSMAPLIRHGNLLAIRRIKNVETGIIYGDLYYVETENVSIVRKIEKSVKLTSCCVLCTNDQNAMTGTEVPFDSIKAIYRIEAVMDFKML